MHPLSYRAEIALAHVGKQGVHRSYAAELIGDLYVLLSKNPQDDRPLRKCGVGHRFRAETEPQRQLRAGFRLVNRLKGHHQMRSLPKGEVPGVMRGTLGGRGIK